MVNSKRSTLLCKLKERNTHVKIRPLAWTLWVALLSTVSASLSAQVLPASDNAADAAYNSGWTNGSNGGTNFQSWIFSQSNNSNGGFFVGNSNNNGGGTGPGINVASEAFGLYANSGVQTTAYRPLIGTLGLGQTLSLDFDNGWIDTGGSAGFYFANASNTARFTFYFSGGDSQYRFVDGSGTHGTGLGFTEGGLRASFTLDTPTSYTFEVSQLASSSSFTHSGTIAASDISRFVFFNNNAGGGSQRDVYVNNLQAIEAIPEPVFYQMSALLAFGSIGFYRLRRRR
jgi:hypothetical protein